MTDKLPATPAELTPAMLNELLADSLDGGTIISVEAHDIGEGTGIFGQIARLDLGVDGDAAMRPHRSSRRWRAPSRPISRSP